MLLNELIVRSMIQPIDINVDDEGMQKSYRVHDMVIDLVYFLPSEENFVTKSWH